MRALLAEDDPATAVFVKRGLAACSIAVHMVESGLEAIEAGTGGSFDIVILDRMLPGLEGLDVLRKLREAGVLAPVLVLTAKGGIADRVAGLDAGADDYLVKPFALAELVARVNALLRRPPINSAVTRLEVGDVVIDMLRREVTRGRRPIHLQPREFGILEVLMRNAGKAVTRTMILEHVWGFHFDPETNIVESHLSRMRSKLREGFHCDLIETVRGVGYRMRIDA